MNKMHTKMGGGRRSGSGGGLPGSRNNGVQRSGYMRPGGGKPGKPVPVVTTKSSGVRSR